MRAGVVPLAVVLALAAPARGDEVAAPQVVVAPAACGQFWTIPGDVASPAAWDNLISFASCIQDRRIYVVEDADRLAALVDELRAALAPSLQLFSTAIQHGPPTVQLRAAFHVGLAQVTLMTRARASLATSELRTTLEPLLEPHAELAYFVFTTIHRAAADDPGLTPDVVTRYMARASGELAAALRRRWSTPPGDDEPRVARPR